MSTAVPSHSRASGPVAIRQQDFIQSIADAFQFISFYHPVDFITAISFRSGVLE